MSKTPRPTGYTVIVHPLRAAKATEQTVRSRKVADVLAARALRTDPSAAVLVREVTKVETPIVGYLVVRTGPGGFAKRYPERGAFERRETADRVASFAAAKHGTHVVVVEPVRAA